MSPALPTASPNVNHAPNLKVAVPPTGRDLLDRRRQHGRTMSSPSPSPSPPYEEPTPNSQSAFCPPFRSFLRSPNTNAELLEVARVPFPHKKIPSPVADIGITPYDVAGIEIPLDRGVMRPDI